MDILFARGETYKAELSHALDKGDKFTVKLHSQDTDHEMSNHLFRDRPDAMKRNALADVDASGLQLHYQHQAWTIGLDVDEATHNTDIINPTKGMFYVYNFNDVERDRRSAFVEFDGAISDSWKVKSGVRVTHVEMDAGTVDSSMVMMNANVATLRDDFNNSDRSQDDTLLDIAWVMTHSLSETLDVELGLARKERAPSYQERYLWLPLQSTSGLADGNNHIGNVDLDPETAYQLELGLDWHTPKAAVSPRVFYHHINDYIQGTAVPMSNMPAIMVSTMMGGDTTPLQFNNVDAKLYGFDTNWFVALTNDWQLDGTVSYVRGKRRDTSDDLYRIAPLTARTMLSYNQMNWHVGIEAVTVAKQRHVSTENEEEKTSGYGLINLSGSYSPNSQMKINAGINNLFDRSYQDHLAGYNRNNTSADIAVGERLYGLGRSAYVNLSLSW
jgi:iron complex outermembrane receptor protein